MSRLQAAGFVPGPIALGCEPLGGTDWGDVDVAEVRRAVRRALDLGINTFDTADVYGLGRSEEELSRALGSDRRRALIITKFGVRWDSPCSEQRASTRRDASPHYLVTALEASLRRLRLDAVPLYLVHWPDPFVPLAETLGALEQARRAGKVISYGLSNFSANEVAGNAETFPVAAVEGEFSLLNTGTSSEMFDVARQHGITRLAYGVLAQGLLTGKYDETSSFGTNDRRRRLPWFSGEGRQNARAVLDAVREVAARHGRTVPQTAIRWALDSGRVDSVVVGAKSVRQVESNLGALGWSLENEEWDRLLGATAADVRDGASACASPWAGGL
jgi:aryl-alcohol dehydrogenase-like predicted oxidoreductase